MKKNNIIAMLTFVGVISLSGLLGFSKIENPNSSEKTQAFAVFASTPTKPCATKVYPEFYEGSGACTGNLSLEIDLPTVDLSLIYNSTYAPTQTSNTTGQFGSAWELSSAHSVVVSGADLLLRSISGYEARFLPDSDETNTWRAKDRNIKGKFVLDGIEFKFLSGERKVAKYKLYNGSANFYLYATENNGKTELTINRNAQGRLDSIVDQYGIHTDFTYSGTKVTSISNPRGGNYQLSYTNEQLTSVVWPDNRSYVIAYTPGSNLVESFSLPNENATGYDYYRNGEIKTIRETGKNPVNVEYDANLVTITQQGVAPYQEYFETGMLRSVNQEYIETVYDRFSTTDSKNKRVSKITSKLGTETALDYYTEKEKEALVKSVTYNRIGAPAAETWLASYQYNINGYLTVEANQLPGGTLKTLQYYRDSSDKLTKILPITGGGASTFFDRDASGILTKISLKIGSTVVKEQNFNTDGKLISAANNLTGDQGSWAYPDDYTVAYTAPYGDTLTVTKDSVGTAVKVKAAISGFESGIRLPTLLDSFRETYKRSPSGTEVVQHVDVTYPSRGHSHTVSSTTTTHNVAAAGLHDDSKMMANMSMKNLEAANNGKELYLASKADKNSGGKNGECDGDGDGDGDDDANDAGKGSDEPPSSGNEDSGGSRSDDNGDNPCDSGSSSHH